MSIETDLIVERLKLESDGYRPNAQVAHALGEKIAVPIVGPVAVGKSTVIDEIVRLDPGAAASGTFMTRPRRPVDAPMYRFLPHDEENLGGIKAKVLAGELVQYTVHPSTGFVYGSETGDYPAAYNVMAVLSSAMPAFEALPFRGCATIALTAEPDAWEAWYHDRSQQNTNPEDDRKRLLEARQSLQWCMGQAAISWVVNVPDQPEAAARRIINIMHSAQQNDSSARDIGERLFDRIEKLLEG